MREIKFRGKIINDPNNILNGLWCYGNLDNHGESIVKIRRYRKDARGGVMVAVYQVEPETVGQFTGLRDKEGNEIYEGDIVDMWDEVHPLTDKIEYKGRFIVSWNKECAGFELDEPNQPISEPGFNMWVGSHKIVGNIHENPELLNE